MISGSNAVMAADVFVDKFLLKVLCANKFTNRSIFNRCSGTDNFEKVLSRIMVRFNLFFSSDIQNIKTLGYSISKMQLRVRKSLDNIKDVEKSPPLADDVVL